MSDFVVEHGLDEFEHIADQQGSLWQAFNITAQPSFVFIDDNGEVRRHIGSLEMDDMIEQLDQLVAS